MLIFRMLAWDPANRISIQDALQDPFFIEGDDFSINSSEESSKHVFEFYPSTHLVYDLVATFAEWHPTARKVPNWPTEPKKTRRSCKSSLSSSAGSSTKSSTKSSSGSLEAAKKSNGPLHGRGHTKGLN